MKLRQHKVRIGRVTLKRPANVVVLSVPTTLDLDPARVLAAALEGDLRNVIVAGETKDGEGYFSTNMASGPEVIWHVEQLKRMLLSQ